MKLTKNFFFISFILSCLFIFLRLEIVFGSDTKAPFTDDFYYYLTTAKNFKNFGIVSFDQISLTNGYQPLWFIIILIFKYFINNDLTLNILIIFTIFFLSLLIFFNFKNYLIQCKYTEEESVFISVLISYLTLFFSKNGMEAALAVFLFSSSILYLNKNIVIFSFLGFLTFLSRLEFIFVYLIILSNEVFLKKKILNYNYILKLSIFPLLLIIYVLVNIYFFNLPFPESGIAKSLTRELKFNNHTFSFLMSGSNGMKFISLLFYINCIGVLFIFSNKTKVFTKILLISVLIFFLSNSLRSPWPLWTWHFIFLAISTPLLLNDLLNYSNKKLFKFLTGCISIFFLSSYFYLFQKDINAKSDHILNLANQINSYYQFSDNKIFAMGDMAGKTSYLLNKKLIQLEGLVSGKNMINNIKSERNLCSVLKEYKVDVYLASRIERKDSVINLREPSLKSKNIKRMKGTINSQPNKVFKSENINIYAFESNDENNNCF